MPNETQFDFKKFIVDARTPAALPENHQGTAVELPALFEEPSETPPIISEEVPEDKVSIQIAMQQHTKVYILWKPWEECARCRMSMEGDMPSVVLPDDGDHECPHIQLEQYKETCDACLRGDAILVSKEFFNLPNGTRCVHVEWMLADPEAMEKLKKDEAAKNKDRVYPPNVEAAFAKKSPDTK